MVGGGWLKTRLLFNPAMESLSEDEDALMHMHMDIIEVYVFLSSFCLIQSHFAFGSHAARTI